MIGNPCVLHYEKKRARVNAHNAAKRVGTYQEPLTMVQLLYQVLMSEDPTIKPFLSWSEDGKSINLDQKEEIWVIAPLLIESSNISTASEIKPSSCMASSG
jgi:hypothetical protein